MQGLDETKPRQERLVIRTKKSPIQAKCPQATLGLASGPNEADLDVIQDAIAVPRKLSDTVLVEISNRVCQNARAGVTKRHNVALDRLLTNPSPSRQLYNTTVRHIPSNQNLPSL